ncbi:MAG TPA: hypothetical protein VFI64_02010, partial [Nitrososphaeraceae archaeon]|nr:hypothetical protein [Nitrososphaeraceae archaeon]
IFALLPGFIIGVKISVALVLTLPSNDAALGIFESYIDNVPIITNTIPEIIRIKNVFSRDIGMSHTGC